MSHSIHGVATFGAKMHMMVLGGDGYVRMGLQTFLKTPLLHLISGLDDDIDKVLAHQQEGATLAHVSGYTEWVSATTPGITLGWDWQLDVSQGHDIYVRQGQPRCNIMFVDAIQRDLGYVRTLLLLEAAIDEIGWREETHKHIASRYR